MPPATRHWNGRAWRRVASPNPPGGGVLSGVTASGGQAWAVGGYLGGYCGGYRTLVLHWNGRAWRRVPSPTSGNGGPLWAVMASARGTWAVGGCAKTMILRPAGSGWKQVPAPSPPGSGPDAGSAYRGLAAASSREVWAVGYVTGTRSPALIVRWNGRAWRRVLGLPAGSLSAVAVTSPRNAWAVGGSGSKTLILRWNGTSWR